MAATLELLKRLNEHQVEFVLIGVAVEVEFIVDCTRLY